MTYDSYTLVIDGDSLDNLNHLQQSKDICLYLFWKRVENLE